MSNEIKSGHLNSSVDKEKEFWSNGAMNYRTLNILSLFLLAAPLYGGETLKEQIAKEITLLKETSDSGKKSQILFRLATSYLQDQELDKAFLSFLEGLKNAPHLESAKMSISEKALYEEALQFYLLNASVDPFKTSQELIEKYQQSSLPEYTHLNFLLSAAYANVGNFALFFEHFSNGYPRMWDSFLAYKTQAVLCLRLSQRSTSTEKRHHYQQEAVRLLSQALEKNARDPGLYKILISLAKEDKKDSLVLSYLQKMVKSGAPMSRVDIFTYVREAVELEEYELAQEMIDHAREQYKESRAIAAAQDYLDQHKQS